MTTGSLSAFVDAVRASGLLEEAQRDDLEWTLRPRFPEPQALAAELVRRGWLTPYQATRLLEGKAADLVLGQYVLLERLGEGGMGEVFKARHRLMKRIVALKVIRPDRLADAEAIHRFHREIEAAAQLAHPNIITAHDANQVGNVHFLVMEYVEGIDLARLSRQVGPLPVGEACEYIRQAALGLQHAAEKGLVHRDIKPSNLLVTLAGRTGSDAQPVPVVKVLDMGLALLQEITAAGESESALTHVGAVMGTPDYISPEQATNSHAVDIRSDLYSLGCTLYHLLAGTPPFPGGTLMEKLIKHKFAAPRPVELHRPDLPAGVSAIIRRLMAKLPEERYQTPADLAAALQPFCSLDKCSLGPLPETLFLPGSQSDASGSASTLGTVSPRAETMKRDGPVPDELPPSSAGPVPVTAGSGSASMEVWPSIPPSAEPPGLEPWSAQALPAAAEAAAAGPPAETGPAPRRQAPVLAFLLATLVLLAAFAIPAVLYWHPNHPDPDDSSLVEEDRKEATGKTTPELTKKGRPPDRKDAGAPVKDDKPKDDEKKKPPEALPLPRVIGVGKGFPIRAASFSRLGNQVLLYNGKSDLRLYHQLDSPNAELRYVNYPYLDAVDAPLKTLLSSRGDCALFGLFGRTFDGKTVLKRGMFLHFLNVRTAEVPGNKRPFYAGEGGGEPPITSMALQSLPKGAPLALTGDQNGHVHVWDLGNEGGGPVCTLLGHNPDIVTCLAFSLNGMLAASGTSAGEVCLWNLKEPMRAKLLYSFEPKPHQKDVTCLSFAKDGQLLLTGSEDQSLRIWRIGDGAPKAFLPQCWHDKPVTCVAVDVNSRYALTGTKDGKVCLWDLKSGKEVRGFQYAHPGKSPILAVTFDAHGCALSVAGGEDNSIRRKPLPE